MSTTIENRVVKMEFDNSQFESNVKTSLSTLDKLKQALDFKGATKGLDSIASAAKGFSLTAIDTAVTTVTDKFSVFEQMAIGALRNIGAKAVDTGTQLLKGLSVDNISKGWDKYVDKTASVQAIMNATGLSIDDVNGYLDKLMWYSDETSFGFTDMTAALAQMTSTGGDIEKIVPLLMGVGNATAFAGKGAAEFQRSIFNLSQSYGSGYLQLMDWKSLENAGTASKQLKDALIDAAVAMGKIDEGEVTIENFRDSLKNGWADRDVMEAAFGRFAEQTQKAYELVQNGQFELASDAYDYLEQYADDFTIKAAKAAQEAKSWEEAIDSVKDAVSSGWMRTFEYIFGDYEEGVKVWTWWANTLWDVFNGGAEFRNDVMAGWKEAGGRELNVWGIYNTWMALADIIGTVKEEAMKVFGLDKDEEGWISFLLDLSQKFYDWSESITPTNLELLNIRFTAEKVFTVINKLRQIVGSALSKAFNAAKIAVSAFKESFSTVFTDSTYVSIIVFLRNIKDLIDNFELGEGAADNLKKAFTGILSFFSLIGKAISGFVDVFGVDIMNALSAVITKVLEIAGKIGDFITGLNDSAKETDFFKEKFTTLRDTIVTVASKIWEWLGNAKTAITNFVNALKENDQFIAFIDKLKSLKDSLWDVITVTADSAFTKIENWFTSLGDKLPTAEEVATAVGDIATKIGEFVDNVKDFDPTQIGAFFDDLFTSLFSNGDDVEDESIITKLINAVKKILNAVFTDEGVISTVETGAQTLVQKIIDKIKEVFRENFSGIGFIDILNALNMAALLNIAMKLGNFFGSISDAMDNVSNIPLEVVNVLKALKGTIQSYQADLNATTLLKVAAAILLLAAAVVALALVPDTNKVYSAAIGLALVMGILALVINAFASLQRAKNEAGGIKAAQQINSYLEILSTGASKALQSFGTAAKFIGFGLGFLGVVAALGLIVAEAYIFSKMLKSDPKMIITALTWMLVIVAAVGVVITQVSRLSDGAADIIAFGTTFVALGAAFILMAAALKIVAGIEGDVVKAALVVGLLAALMVGLVVWVEQSRNISGDELVKIGNMFLKMSACLVIIGAALALVSLIPSDKVLADAGALALAIAAVSVALMALMWGDEKWENLDTAINSLYTACKGILMIGAALALIAASGADWETFGVLVLSFLSAIAILMIAAAIVDASGFTLAVALLAIAAAVTLVGVGMLAAGVGVLAFAAAMLLLSNNSEIIPTVLANIAAGIISFGSALQGHVGDLLLFIAAMIGFAAAGAAIALAVVAVVAGIVILGAVLADALKKIGDGISIGGIALIAAIGVLIASALAFIIDSTPGIVDGIIKTIIIIINTISLAILDNTSPLFEALGLLFATTLNMLALGLAGLLAGFLEALGASGAAEKVKDWADTEFGPNSETAAAIRANNEQLKQQVKEDFTSIGNAAAEGVQAAEKPDYSEFGPTEGDIATMTRGGADLGTALTTEYTKTVEGANTPEVTKGLSGDDAKAEQRAAAKTLSDEFSTAYESEMTSAAETSSTPWVDRLEDQSRQKYYDSGYESAGVYRTGEGLGFDQPVSFNPADGLRSFGGDYEQLGYGYGSNFDEFLANGIDMNSFIPLGSADGLNLDIQSLMNNPDAFSQIMSGNMLGGAEGIDIGGQNILSNVDGLNLDIMGQFGNTQPYNDMSYANMQASAEGIRSAGPDVTAAATEVADSVSTAFDDSYDSSFEAGANVSFGFGAGMYSNMSAISDAAGYISDNAAAKFDEGSDEANTAGQELVSQFSVGMITKNGIAEASAQFVADNVGAKIDSKKDAARTSGQDLITYLSNGIRSMTNQATGAALSVVSSITQTIQTMVPVAFDTGASIISNLSATLSSSAPASTAAYQLGSTVALSLASGINDYSRFVYNAMDYIVRSLGSYTGTGYNYGYNTGANFSNGMARGIYDYAYSAYYAAAYVAAQAAAAARSYLQIQSPSRVAAEIGMYFDQGLAVGLNDNVDYVVDAADYVTQNAVDSFNKVVSRINDVLDGNIDIDPTIRPVLDLSGIQNGAKDLDGMLSGSYSYAARIPGGFSNISTTSQIMTGLDSLASKISANRQTPNINITVNAGDVSDPNELADIISDRIQFKYAQIGASIGG